MRNLFFFCAASVVALCAAQGCSNDPVKGDEPEKPVADYYEARFKSTDLPAIVPWQGGRYAVTVDYSKVTRTGDEYLPWLMRVTVDGVPGTELEFTADKGEFDLAPNVTAAARRVSVEIRADQEWTAVAEASQDCALVEAAGVQWARGNLTVSVSDEDATGNRFVIAESAFDPGFFFRHMSPYGVSGAGDVYDGTAYNPAPVRIGLSEIPENIEDPCALVADGDFRTPTFGELSRLLATIDEDMPVREGVTFMSFDGGRLLLPMSGAVDIASGDVGYRNTHAAYRGSGAYVDGMGAIMFMSADYAGIDYDAGISLSSVRCVRATAVPRYVSHSPAAAPDAGGFELKVVTSPGDFDEYVVSLLCSDGSQSELTVTGEAPEALFDVPANPDPEPLTYHIMVDGDYSGRSVVQPGIADYAFYVSHSPAAAGYEAFELTVTCRSDMASFPVSLSSADGLQLTLNASASNPVAVFSVPANESLEPRTIEIFVGGVATGQAIVQEGAPQPQGTLSVEWSTGYLTVVSGAFGFAGETERGLYFKYKSPYGFHVDPEPPASSSVYSGTVYGPQPTAMAYADIPSAVADPCALVAPAGMWRMPTVDECKELLSLDFEFEASQWRMYSDGVQRVYLTPSGSLKDTGTGLLAPGFVRVWTASPKDASTYYTISGGLSTASSAFNATVGAKPGVGMMVRCVRDK